MSSAYVSPFVWDQSGNYPGGAFAWSGTPKRVAPAQTYFTPNLKPPAQNFNDILASLSARQQYEAPMVPLAGQEWRPLFAGSAVITVGASSAQQFSKAVYDPSHGAWLMAAQYSAVGLYGAIVYQSDGFDDGTQWINAANGGSAVIDADAGGIPDVAVCLDPTPGLFWGAAIKTTANTVVIAISSYTSSTYTNKATISGAGVAKYLEMATIGSRVCVAIGGSFLGIYSGNSSTAFAAVTLGSGVISGQGWYLKSNGSVMIAVPSLATSPTVLWTSGDGITFTSHSLSSVVPTGGSVVGLDWSVTNSLWYMAVQATSSSLVIWSSPNGATWTQVTPGTAPNVEIADLVCVASGLVMVSIDQPVRSYSTAAQRYYSPDFGITWYPGASSSPAVFPSNLASSASGYTRARLASSGTKLLAWNTSFARFSNAAGLPTTHL